MNKKSNIFLDTNIFVNVLNKEKDYYEHSLKILNLVQNGIVKAYTSVICISEILIGFYQQSEYDLGEHVLSTILSIENLTILDYDMVAAIDAAKIRSDTRLKLPDSVILSQSVKTNSILITHDDKLLSQYPDTIVYSAKNALTQLKI